MARCFHPAKASRPRNCRLSYLPEFAQEWYANARAALADLQTGLHTHPLAILALIAAIPVIMFLRGLFGYLNVYFLQWAASRTHRGFADAAVRASAEFVRRFLQRKIPPASSFRA